MFVTALSVILKSGNNPDTLQQVNDWKNCGPSTPGNTMSEPPAPGGLQRAVLSKQTNPESDILWDSLMSHSWNGKSTATETDEWLPGAEEGWTGRNMGESTKGCRRETSGSGCTGRVAVHLMTVTPSYSLAHSRHILHACWIKGHANDYEGRAKASCYFTNNAV